MIRRDFSKFYILGGLLAAIFLLIFLNSVGWLERPKNIFYRITIPLLKPFQIGGAKFSEGIKLISELKQLIKENSRLKQENQDLLLKVSSLAEVVQENKLLREQLQLKPAVQSKMTLAQIVGFSPENLGQHLLIDKGKKDGVKENQAVIFAGGFLIGKIMETQDYSSQVLLLVDSRSSVFSLTQETRIGGVVKGDHGVGLIMEIIPQQKQVREGEIVISSGIDGYLAKGLIIGQVEAKISLESEALQRFKIKPAINYKEIESVFVVLGNE